MKKIILIILLLSIILSGCITLQRTHTHWCHCEHPNKHCFYTEDEEICICRTCGGYISIKELPPYNN